MFFFFFSSRRRHTRSLCDWSSDVCSSDLARPGRAVEVPMTLPLEPPLLPMLAKPSRTLPDEPGSWAYEPKWDGFRVVVFVDGDTAELRSRNDKQLGRYFPELAFAPGRYVLDGEIVVRDAV